MFQEAGLLRNLVNFSGFIFHPGKAFFTSVHVPDTRWFWELLNLLLEINSRTSQVLFWTNAGGWTQNLICAVINLCATCFFFFPPFFLFSYSPPKNTETTPRPRRCASFASSWDLFSGSVFTQRVQKITHILNEIFVCIWWQIRLNIWTETDTVTRSGARLQLPVTGLVLSQNMNMFKLPWRAGGSCIFMCQLLNGIYQHVCLHF